MGRRRHALIPPCEEEWKADAPCRGLTSLFYSVLRDEQELAKQVCHNGCPVREACLDYALVVPEGMFGVWGGTTEEERESLRRRRKKVG